MSHSDAVVVAVALGEGAVGVKQEDPLHKHNTSYHSSSNSESNAESPRLSDGGGSSSTSVDDVTVNKELRHRETGSSQRRKQSILIDQLEDLPSAATYTKDYNAPLREDIDTAEPNDDAHSILDNRSFVQTNSYVQDLNDDRVLLNKRVIRTSSKSRRNTQESLRKNIPFQASKHSQILPLDTTSIPDTPRPFRHNTNLSMSSLPVPMAITKNNKNASKLPSTSYISLPPAIPNAGALKRSESATAEIKKMRESLLHKREIKWRRKSFLLDDDRVLIGNKVSEGHVNFIIAYNMLTGIRVAVSRCSGIMKPLTTADFRFTKKLAFDYHGNELTPSSKYAFKFKDYCPEVFRELRALFGLDPADYLVSLTSKYILSELNSPGKSGSFFYFSRDYKYIIKTIHHTEHIHLRKHLREYYTHVKTNPDTLLCQFYGLHRVKMPISFQNKIKHRKIYFLVMNNVFPPHLELHKTFDLKGSTWGRLTNVDKTKLQNDPNYRPVLKDLNWIDQREKIKFGPLKKKKFLNQLRKDVELLTKLNTMDYSLLIGIHYIPQEDNSGNDDTFAIEEASTRQPSDDKHVTTVVPHYFKGFEGGIRSSDQFNKDMDAIYYISIIDCLTNYSLVKKLETFWRGLTHDLKMVSAVPPKEYGDRFFRFIEDSVESTPKKRYKDHPELAPYRD